ncbi:MAG TPA: sodium:proton antiporter [Methanocorpusculum sp.]|nr:sodium:proton antiporter [Methanocorpusculum sp.]
MSSGLIAKTAARLLVPFIIIFGFYVVMHGHLSPGGGFQGGAVAATGVALLVAAFALHDGEEMLPEVKNIKLIESAGLILFICTAIAAAVCGGGLLVNWLAGSGGLFGNFLAAGSTVGDLWTGGMIPVLNFAVGIEVFGAMSVIILYMFKGLRETTQAEDDAAAAAAAAAAARTAKKGKKQRRAEK